MSKYFPPRGQCTQEKSLHLVGRLALIGLLVLALACAEPPRDAVNETALSPLEFPPGDTAGGGFDGLRETAPALVDPDATYVDELGYVQPLDVHRPRPPKAAVVPPSREEIARARALKMTSPFPETRLGPDDGHTQNETAIDVDGNTLIAGWNNFTNNSLAMGWARSTDGGQTWSSQLFNDAGGTSDPVVKAGGGGRWYYAYILNSGDWEVVVRRSTDDGATWSNPVQVTNDSDFDDKPYMDAAGDTVLVAYADFGFSPARIRASRSLDGGQSFGNDTVISDAGGNGPVPVVGPEGNFYVFWRPSVQDFLHMSRSLDQGTTWGTDTTIVPMNILPNPLPGESFRIINIPSAAVDPISGDVVVVWHDQAFGDPDILAIRSSDAGSTWSAPVRINDDAGITDQFFPWVTSDDTGAFYAVWYDKRQNGSDIDVYMARSIDGGQTWEANIRVTGMSYDAVLPWEGHAAVFIGDYNGIAAQGGVAYPFYQDARSGLQDVYVATVDLSAPQCAVDADCDDGLFCNGAETCSAGTCQAGFDPCGGGACDEAGDVCTSVCGDGTCDVGENCNTCGADCPSFPLPSAVCGNGLCEAGDGEDCLTCAQDCAGQQGGKPAGRFCCGFGGENPVGCGNAACTTGGFSCTETPQGSGGDTCCGDFVCEGPEDGTNCAVDCGAPPQCDDGTCDPGEDACTCPGDCGLPPVSEAGFCADGLDNDCDVDVDCTDADCATDPTCEAVDCPSFGDKTSCNAEPTCRWDNKNKVCVAN